MSAGPLPSTTPAPGGAPVPGDAVPGASGGPGAPVTPPSGGEPRSLTISPAQLTILVVCFVSIYFVISFYGKSLDSYRINQRAAQARQENVRLDAQIKELQERVAYFASESYVETAAREKLNLVKPGDRPIVILPAQAEVATVEGPPSGTDAMRPFVEFGHLADWLYLFFGSR